MHLLNPIVLDPRSVIPSEFLTQLTNEVGLANITVTVADTTDRGQCDEVRLADITVTVALEVLD